MSSAVDALLVARSADRLARLGGGVGALRQVAWAIELGGLGSVVALGPGLLTDPQAGAVVQEILASLAAEVGDPPGSTSASIGRVRRCLADLMLVVSVLTQTREGEHAEAENGIPAWAVL